ncbi:MAG: peptide chain release factor 1 [Endomicrobiales bacterium]|nr:peptide chain release factor 1 [Endomicrobiales bacterium]
MFEERIKSIETRFEEVEKRLSDPAVLSVAEDYKKYTKEHAYLAPLVNKIREIKNVKKEIENLNELRHSSDTEIKVMAASEHEELSQRKARLDEELKVLLIPPDENEGKNIIVEIRAGTGGEEAALFAGDLFRMYARYAENNKWKLELMEGHSTGLGGFKEVIFGVSGRDAWKHFKHEKGIHRVQRVPKTEASGRIHTSAVTVAVLPEAEEIEVDIRPEDLRVDTYRASGAGGQHVNKTDSAIRITHLPTGVVVACQEERSQIKNRAKAMKMLRAKLFEAKQNAQAQALGSARKQQVGSGDRSEKIRTYNFPQNRITDHRIDFSIHRLSEVLDGDLDELISQLIKYDQETRLAGAVAKENNNG